jgi:hypothetical protein
LGLIHKSLADRLGLDSRVLIEHRADQTIDARSA